MSSGCLEVFSTPCRESSWQIPWVHSLFATLRRINAIDGKRRTSGFAEVVDNLDEKNPLFVARRCMSCGNCLCECPCGAIKMEMEDI